MMSTTSIPKLTEKQIEDWVGSKSFEKGKRYFQNEAIYEARWTGDTLKASCEGSYDNVYRLWVKISKTGINEAEFSCPVGSRGSCKHIAVLLLTWNTYPEEFPEAHDVEKTLGIKKPDCPDLATSIVKRLAGSNLLRDL